MTDAVEKAMEKWMRQSNSVYAFVQDCLERDINSFEIKDVVYDCYKEYCDINDLNPVSKNVFARELQRFIKVRSERKKIQGERKQVWAGIRINWGYFEREGEQEEESGTLEEFLDNKSAFEEFLEGDEP